MNVGMLKGPLNEQKKIVNDLKLNVTSEIRLLRFSTKNVIFSWKFVSL